MRVTAAVALVMVLAAGCGDPSGPHATVHSGRVGTNETWTRAGSPHIVTSGAHLVTGATLTIEAGATVLFDSLALLTFKPSGTLRALGTPAHPIIMGSHRSTAGPGFWKGLSFRSNTASEMHYVELSGCGGHFQFFDSLPNGCIWLGLLPDESPTLLVDHVTVHDARGGAVIVSNDSHFAPGSTHLSVLDMRGYAASMRAREAATFPLGGAFTGNDSNEVRLTLDTLRDSVQWGAGVPWTVMGTIFVEGPKQPLLTIPADATVRLRGRFDVGTTEPGGMEIGSAGGQTLTLSAADTSWGGIYFGPHTTSTTLTNVILEQCGRRENISFYGECVLISGLATGPLTPAPVFTHVTIRNSASNVGLGLTYRGRLGPGSTDLTITGTGIPFSIVGGSPASIPPGSYTGNERDIIEITEGRVRQDETWPNLGLPYFFTNFVIAGDSGVGVSIGDATTHPTLTLVPGTTFEFSGQGRVWVGWEGHGAVHAVGTDSQPIRFLGGGIHIGSETDSSTIFDHVVVDGSTSYFYVDIGPIIRNTVIRNSPGCGILIVGVPAWSTDFTDVALGNTFTNNVGGAVCGP